MHVKCSRTQYFFFFFLLFYQMWGTEQFLLYQLNVIWVNHWIFLLFLSIMLMWSLRHNVCFHQLNWTVWSDWSTFCVCKLLISVYIFFESSSFTLRKKDYLVSVPIVFFFFEKINDLKQPLNLCNKNKTSWVILKMLTLLLFVYECGSRHRWTHG